MSEDNESDYPEGISKRARSANPLSKLVGGLPFDADNPAFQVVVGGTSGWVVGYVSIKLGRTAAVALGGGFLLIQIASQYGYLTIDWTKVNNDVDKAQRLLTESESIDQVDTYTKKIKKVMLRNTALSISFLGGLFLGLAS